MSQQDREIALLALAVRGLKRMDVDDLSAISELADEDGQDLAGYLRRWPTLGTGTMAELRSKK